MMMMMVRTTRLLAIVVLSLLQHSSYSLSVPIHRWEKKQSQSQIQRRTFASLCWTTVIGGTLATSASVASAAPTPAQVTIELQSPQKLGLELYDVIIGTPPLPVVAIRRITADSKTNRLLQPGMVLRDYQTAADVQERVIRGPFPVKLKFSNLAAAGDAMGDTGAPLVTSQDALDLARRSSSTTPTSTTVSQTQSPTSSSSYSVTTFQKPTTTCNIPSRRNDLLEIIYEARLSGPEGIVYDSSVTRGTGQPYQMVLGSGDMLPGVDQGLYQMCPGQTRGLQIPPLLAYGPRGNKLFRIPPDQPLYWQVRLVSVNGVREGDTRTRDTMEGRE